MFGSGRADRIAYFPETGGELWQGGFPARGNLGREGVSLLILCAKELQPDTVAEAREHFGCDVALAPLNDVESGPTSAEIALATAAAREAVRHIRRGGRVLSSCAMGRNRSSLCTAIILMMLTKMSGDDAVRAIRACRAETLTNRGFVGFLRRVHVR